MFRVFFLNKNIGRIFSFYLISEYRILVENAGIVVVGVVRVQFRRPVRRNRAPTKVRVNFKIRSASGRRNRHGRKWNRTAAHTLRHRMTSTPVAPPPPLRWRCHRRFRVCGQGHGEGWGGTPFLHRENGSTACGLIYNEFFKSVFDIRQVLKGMSKERYNEFIWNDLKIR